MGITSLQVQVTFRFCFLCSNWGFLQEKYVFPFHVTQQIHLNPPLFSIRMFLLLLTTLTYYESKPSAQSGDGCPNFFICSFYISHNIYI